MKPVLEQFITVVASSFLSGQDQMKPSTQFRKLASWTSLQSLLVVAAIDEAFGIALKEKELNQASTLEELHRIVTQKME